MFHQNQNKPHYLAQNERPNPGYVSYNKNVLGKQEGKSFWTRGRVFAATVLGSAVLLTGFGYAQGRSGVEAQQTQKADMQASSATVEFPAGYVPSEYATLTQYLSTETGQSPTTVNDELLHLKDNADIKGILSEHNENTLPGGVTEGPGWTSTPVAVEMPKGMTRYAESAQKKFPFPNQQNDQ